MIRAVLDTNVMVSGTFWRGIPRAILRSAIAREFVLVCSSDIIAELLRVISRDKFEKLRTVLGLSAAEIVAVIQEIAELVIPADVPPDMIRDPKDISVLACAVGGQANVIVSGDKDLLSIGAYANIPILDPAKFLELLSRQQTE
jgi:putative PIN family toxin of toxin-antitoxin system